MSLRHLQQKLQPRAGFTFWTVEHMNQDSVLPTHNVHHPPPVEADMHSNPHSFETEPPKLPQRSGCSRLFILFACMGCAVFVMWLISVSIVFPNLRGPPSMIEVNHKPLPTMLRRFSHLRRMPPGTGTNPQQLKAMFPHWFDSDGRLGSNQEVVLGDMALAIAQLTKRVAPAVTASVFPDGIDEENSSHSEESDL